MDTAWIALIGTLFGGVVLKLIESILARGNNRIDYATNMRDELRKDSVALKEELRQAEKDLDGWKEKYFLLLQEYLEVKSAHGPVKPEKKRGDDW